MDIIYWDVSLRMFTVNIHLVYVLQTKTAACENLSSSSPLFLSWFNYNLFYINEKLIRFNKTNYHFSDITGQIIENLFVYTILTMLGVPFNISANKGQKLLPKNKPLLQ